MGELILVRPTNYVKYTTTELLLKKVPRALGILLPKNSRRALFLISEVPL